MDLENLASENEQEQSTANPTTEPDPTKDGSCKDCSDEASDAKEACETFEESVAGEGTEPSPKEEETKEKKDPKDLKIEELEDKYRRTMAEFDNFRKRTDKEKSSMYEIGAKDMVEKILPVVDNFERGLATLSEEQKGDAFAQGMEKVYQQMMKSLEEAGVAAIEAVGTEFNPELHNAVMHVEDESLGENVVAEEFQKGYTYRGSVVRHSMVKVAN
ncbi:MAG: nucleotide exchange factor GrpE [Lachnospiraceae bacterium]|nr:nucleotide exchange factor GrpE [Lachnospiraceae bacterium]